MPHGSELGVKILSFAATSPIFKGAGLIVLGILAVLFGLYFKRLNKENVWGFYLFIGISIFMILYGIFLLILRPDWWKLPY
jgi:hypothetical membrane protein